MSWIAPALRLTARLGFRWAPGLGSCLEPPLAPGPGLRPARGLEPRLAPRLGSCLRPRLGSRLRSCLGRRGNVAVVVALLSVPLAGFAGLAVDSARIFLVQSRLQQAVDAAVLTAARQSGQATAQADATALFWTNFGRNDRASNAGFLGASSVAPVITANDATGVVRMEATALVPTTLFAVLRPGPVAVTAAAEATRTVYGMELAIAFDLTGSMHLYSRIEPAKAAARDMINILYGNSDTRPNLSVAIAPFVTSYNIGKTRTAWLQAGSYNAADFGAQGWRGCVEAIPRGQWEASASLAMGRLEQLRHVILPQALRIAIAPTVGFSVQVVKGTAVTSIIGFTELTKTGGMLANATFEPFLIYGLVAVGYFILCYPLSLSARYLERRLHAPA